MAKKFAGSSSPHLREAIGTSRIMQDVCIALIPAGLAGIWFFGLRAAVVMLLCVASCVASEYLYQTHAKKTVRIGDWSAVVTGLLLSYNLPANAPWWLPVVGGALAVVLIKECFGGIGQNFMNPAMGARVILMVSWAGVMTTLVMPQAGHLLAGWAQGGEAAVNAVTQATVNAVSQATPLGIKAGEAVPYTVWDLALGNIPGMLGETSKLALLLGGIYLLCRRVITWHTPVMFLGTAFVLFWIATGTFYAPDTTQSAVYQVLSGGLMLGAFFMATDYVTSPVTNVGKLIMGVGCGVVLFVIRMYNPAYPESCSFAILLMNLLTPMIDRFTVPRSFGEVKARA